MLVAKLPGSTYATAATKAGPRNGRRARRPRVSPFSALSAALRTSSSPGRAVGAGSMATQRSGCSTSRRASARTFNVCLYVNAASKAEQFEDSSLHPLRDHMLESLGLVVDLVPGVAQHLDQEHLEQAVVADELEGDLPAFLGELLAAVPVVLDQALCGEPRDHLAYRRGRDAQPLRQLSCRHRPLVAAQQVERLEIVLLGAGECAAALEGDHLGMPTMKYR